MGQGMRQATLGRRCFAAALLAALAGCAAVPEAGFSPADRATIARVQSSLDALRGLRARFVQSATGAAGSTGTVWYDPGRLRLQYDTPARMTVVASGMHLVAHRESDDSTTRIALSHNPLGLLLRQPLRLAGAIEVTNLQRRPGIVQVSLASRADPAQGLLTLIFADQADGLELVGLQTVDASGKRTDFELLDARTGLAFPPGLFTPPAR